MAFVKFSFSEKATKIQVHLPHSFDIWGRWRKFLWPSQKSLTLTIKTVWRDFSHCAFSCQSWWGFSRSRGRSDFSFHFCKINFQNTRHFFVVFCLLLCLFLFCSNNLLLIYNIWITISMFLCMKISPAVMNFERSNSKCRVAFWQKNYCC